MSRQPRITLLSAASLLGAIVCLVAGSRGTAVEFRTAILRNEVVWQTDYDVAYARAKRDRKLLLVYFDPHSAIHTAGRTSGMADDSVDRQLAVSRNRDLLGEYVFARLSMDVTYWQGDKQYRLIDHPAYAELRANGGVAIIDLAHTDASYYTYVVSVLPLSPGRYYRFHPEYLNVLLDLPEGTLSQRTMVFAVRIHPERPASTTTTANPVLNDEASSHSRYQAQIGVQGHHQWGSRFQRIIGRLFGRGTPGTPKEIVAESWPGENLIDSCIDCVDSWRQSSGHWAAVYARHDSYGYDIQQGSNGIWYATGIFSN
jgi:hypothetical protein